MPSGNPFFPGSVRESPVRRQRLSGIGVERPLGPPSCFHQHSLEASMVRSPRDGTISTSVGGQEFGPRGAEVCSPT